MNTNEIYPLKKTNSIVSSHTPPLSNTTTTTKNQEELKGTTTTPTTTNTIPNPPVGVKIAFLGDTNSGKSSLISNLIHEEIPTGKATQRLGHYLMGYDSERT
jgi:GTP-binding protein EngB required for normal cell division